MAIEVVSGSFASGVNIGLEGRKCLDGPEVATSVFCGIVVAGSRHAVDIRGEGENPPWPTCKGRLPLSTYVLRQKEKLCRSKHSATHPGQLFAPATAAREKGAVRKGNARAKDGFGYAEINQKFQTTIDTN